MSEKFTKGPWKAINMSWEYSMIRDEDAARIAQVFIRDEVDEETQDKFEEIKEANANLIAAAPDMYEALKAYEKAEADIVLNANWYTESGVPQITQEQFDMLIDCQTLRNKALRKARGEEE